MAPPSMPSYELRSLIDDLSDQQLHVLRRYLQFLQATDDPPSTPSAPVRRLKADRVAQAFADGEAIKNFIDELPDRELHAIKRYLQFRSFIGDLPGDPFAQALAGVPDDDEPLTAEDLAAIAESDEDLAAGRTISMEDLKRDLGLTDA